MLFFIQFEVIYGNKSNFEYASQVVEELKTVSNQHEHCSLSG
jgi:hypothetical protein